MIRASLTAVAAISLFTAAAYANDLSGVRCEEQYMLDLIKGELPKMKYDDGSSVAQYLGDNSKLTATTVSTAKDRVVCRISLNFVYNGDRLQVRGQFTYREFAGGKASVTFIPYN